MTRRYRQQRLALARRPAQRRRLLTLLLLVYFTPVLATSWFIFQGSGPTATAGLAEARRDPEVAGRPSVGGGHPVPDVGLAELGRLTVLPEERDGFDRSFFPIWAATSSCRNVRHEVLFEESLVEPELSADGCVVVSGAWFDPYEGRQYVAPGVLEVDHVVPLAEAWESGAWAWPESWRIAFANDLSEPWTLMAVGAAINQSKGAGDPAQWLPPVSAFRCDYARIWVAIKLRWQLAVDPDELDVLEAILASCEAMDVSQ